jgi:hypothetical protein
MPKLQQMVAVARDQLRVHAQGPQLELKGQQQPRGLQAQKVVRLTTWTWMRIDRCLYELYQHPEGTASVL